MDGYGWCYGWWSCDCCVVKWAGMNYDISFLAKADSTCSDLRFSYHKSLYHILGSFSALSLNQCLPKAIILNIYIES